MADGETVEVVALLTRRADLSHEQMVEYYEMRHAPLILSFTPEIVRYERNFLRRDGSIVTPGANEPDFDVVTRLSFADEAAYQKAMARFAEPAVAQAIAEDEENVFDRSRTRFYRVDRGLSTIG